MANPICPEDDDYFRGAIAPANDPDTLDERHSSGTDAPWSRRVHPAPTKWFTDAPPPRTWLLSDTRTDRGFLPLGKAGALVAEGGGSKTQALCQLAISVATGVPFLDHFEVHTQGRVLMLLGEEEDEEVHRRLYNAKRASNAPTPSDDSIVVLPLAGIPCAMLEGDDPRDSEFAGWLFRYVTDNPFALVTIDPLSRFAGMEAETDNAQATRFVQAVERVCSLTGATSLVAHHTNKLARVTGDVMTASARGSSALTDGFRWVASLSVANLSKQIEDAATRKRLGEVVTFAVVKSNYSGRGDPLQLRRDESGGLVPLTEGDRTTVERVTDGTREREAKTEARQAGREKARVMRELEANARRTAKDAERDRAIRARDIEDDEAVRRLLGSHPDAGVKLLAAMVKTERACGSDRAQAAVARVKRGVPTVPAAQKGAPQS